MATVDYSVLSVGQGLQAESDGLFYSAQVVMVSESKNRAKAPVKVHFVGYGPEYDEWVGASRLKSKALKAQVAAKGGKGGKKGKTERPRVFSLPDQIARFERAKKEDNKRYLDITTVYDGSVFKGKRVLIVGASKGLGFEMAKELKTQDAEVIATCRASSPELESAAKQVIKDIDVTSYDSMKKMAEAIKDPLDYVIFNAGYFPDIKDSLDSVQAEEAIKQFDIQACGPIRCIGALKAADKLKGAKVVIISSQAGSTRWRFTQNKGEGGNYGHHMSRAACNIGAALMSEELKALEVPVVTLHPGFNRTTMTAKYAHIWDAEGAVEPSEGAKRVLYECGKITMKTSGQFINCEDGLQIPF